MKDPETYKKEIMDKCSILYCQKNLPMSETCMCWGLDVNGSWLSVIEGASCQLEALNLLYYPKYKVRIQADQVKSKYGTLRFYYSVVCDDKGFLAKIGSKLINLSLKLNRFIDFKMKQVIDKQAYVTNEKEELSKEQYEKYKKLVFNNELQEIDGKYFRCYMLHHSMKCHYEPEKHKLLFKFINYLKNVGNKLYYLYIKNHTKEQNVIINAMYSLANEIISKAENECYNICEECGKRIGEKWSQRCETTGWVSYVCENCAEKSGLAYYKNGELWQNKILIKTKDEANKELEKYYE